MAHRIDGGDLALALRHRPRLPTPTVGFDRATPGNRYEVQPAMDTKTVSTIFKQQ